MRVCITNKYGNWNKALTGKGKFALRLISALRDIGVDVDGEPRGSYDIDVQFNKFEFPVKARKHIIRRGPVHYDTNMDYREHNKECKRNIEKADGIIYQSKYSKRLTDAFVGTFNKPSTIIFNGGRLREKQEAKTKFKHNFLASTREWVWEKRLCDIIESFVCADIKDSRLLIAGTVWDKPERFPQRQKHFIKKYGSDKIVFLGQQSDEQLWSYYDMASALIHCVYIDACPNSVAEAICSRVPIICTNQGGQAELVSACNAGDIIKEKEFDFKPINRRKLPCVEKENLISAMMKIVEYPYPVCGIDNSPLDINNIAKQYLSFFESLLK